MKRADAEAIVKSIVAGTTPKYAFHDISSTKPLRAFGIDRSGAAKIEKRLLWTLSEKNEPEVQGALEIKITPGSTIAGIAAKLPRAYKQSLPAGPASKARVKLRGVRKDDVEIAVRTALAQHSPKFSVFQIKPKMGLRDLGLDKEAVAKAQTTISRMLVGPRTGIKPTDFARGIRGKDIHTVSNLVDQSLLSLLFPEPGGVEREGQTGSATSAARGRISFRGAAPSAAGGGVSASLSGDSVIASRGGIVVRRAASLAGGGVTSSRGGIVVRGGISLPGGSTTESRGGVKPRKKKPPDEEEKTPKVPPK